MNYTLNDVQYLASQSNATNCTLHWSAGGYNTTSDHYHINILGNGEIYSDHDNFDIKLSHTYGRNSNNIGVALCCCADAMVYGDGTVNWGNYPPTDEQIETMAQVMSAIAKGKGWNIDEDHFRTHAEWADIDGYGIHDSDPDMRWDLIEVPNEYGNGGDILRGKAQNY